MASGGVYSFTCCVCTQAKRLSLGLVGRLKARAHLQLTCGWASTSMENPTGKDICDKCLEKWIGAHGSSSPFMKVVTKEE